MQALGELGWTVGRNVRIDTRWAAGDAERLRRHAAELVTLAPDVILASGGFGVGPLLQATRSVPIVFAQVTDPVGAGYVESLAHPGGNATGFTVFEYGNSGKWLELLREIAPRVGAGGGPSGSGLGFRRWANRRDPSGGAAARGRADPDRRA